MHSTRAGSRNLLLECGLGECLLQCRHVQNVIAAWIETGKARLRELTGFGLAVDSTLDTSIADVVEVLAGIFVAIELEGRGDDLSVDADNALALGLRFLDQHGLLESLLGNSFALLDATVSRFLSCPTASAGRDRGCRLGRVFNLDGIRARARNILYSS